MISPTLTLTPSSARNAQILLAIACITWFAVLCFGAYLTPNAFVFGDEAGYLLPILYGSHADNYQRWSILTSYPDYLYFWIYSFLPAGSLHTGAKVLNAGFIAATAIPAYAVGRRYLTVPIAAAFAAVVMLSPISSFVRYVMPEPVYFFGFWLVVLVVLSALDKSPTVSAATGGALIGILSLIKPHALALTLGGCLFFLLRNRLRVRGVIAAVALFLAYYIVRTAFAYLLTGKWIWSVTGSAYAGMLAGYHVDFLATAYNLMGHVNAIVALIAVPLAITLLAVVRRQFLHTREIDNPAIQHLLDLGLFACCMLAAMVMMTVYFSQSVYQVSPDTEHITRLHGRYYVYVFPLFVLVTIGLWQNGVEPSTILPRRAALFLCSAMIMSAAVIFFMFETSFVDYPDLALTSHGRLFVTMLPLAGVLVLSCYDKTRVGTTGVIVSAMIWWAGLGLLTSVSAIVIGPFTNSFALRGPVDAAFFDTVHSNGLHRLVGRSDGIIIGSPTSAVDVYRAMFYLRSMSAGRIVLPGTEIRDDDLPKDVHWAVILPEVNYIGSSRLTHEGSLSVVWR